MSRKFFILFIPVLASIEMSAQGYRFRYGYFHRSDTTSGYTSSPDMNLDYFGGKSVFYREVAFVCDSLSNVAFDEKGNIRNENAYSELYGITRDPYKDYVFVDLQASEYAIVHESAIIFEGKGTLEMPNWNITDETMMSSSGYLCRKATADYMGRRWTIWYAEDIPVNSGPWLFWGAPGLIIHASDTDKLFAFKLFAAEEITDTHRSEFLKNYFEKKKGPKYYQYGIEESEQLYSNFMNNMDVFDQMTGGVTTAAYDRNGNLIEVSWPTYTPIIPNEYWNNK